MRSDRFVMQQAGEADSAEILSLMEENALPGDVSLIYTRRPDPYRSFMAEGVEARLMVCRDTQEGRIAALGAGAVHECLIDHRAEKVAYLFGLRFRREYLAKRVMWHLPGAYRSIVEHFRGQGVRYFLTVILADNIPAQRLLTRERTHMPRHTFLGSYHTLIFLTRRRAPSLPDSYGFRRATPEDRVAIEDFLTVEGGRCDFFPSQVGGLFSRHSELSWESFYLLTDRQGSILACGAAWDQVSHKQYINAGYGGKLRWLYLISPLLRVFGYPAMPKPSTTLRFFTLAFWCAKDNRAEYLKSFLGSLAYEARDYPYFVMGVPAAHPLGPTLHKWRFLGYDSHIYLVGDHVMPADVARVGKSPYLECAWL
ncbi:MAG: hypothetical protein ACM3VT_04400 [Solirubrobacterales bacterium]